LISSVHKAAAEERMMTARARGAGAGTDKTVLNLLMPGSPAEPGTDLKNGNTDFEDCGPGNQASGGDLQVMKVKVPWWSLWT